jgi:hypothetical protein
MLQYVGWHDEAAAIEAAVADSVVTGNGTAEIGGTLGTLKPATIWLAGFRLATKPGPADRSLIPAKPRLSFTQSTSSLHDQPHRRFRVRIIASRRRQTVAGLSHISSLPRSGTVMAAML